MPLALFAQAAGSVLAQKMGGGGGGLGGALGGALGGGEAGADVMPSDMSSKADGTFKKGNITINRAGGVGANGLIFAAAAAVLLLLTMRR